MIFDGDFPPSLQLLSFCKQLGETALARAEELNPQMTRNQIRLVVILGQPVPMKDVADALMMQPSNLTSLVNACEAAGWVLREASAADRRSRSLVLTQAGQTLRGQLVKQLAQITCGLSGITETEAKEAMALLR